MLNAKLRMLPPALIALSSLLGSTPSLAKYAQGTCLKTARARLTVNTCAPIPEMPSVIDCKVGWTVEKTIEFKYSGDPTDSEAVFAPGIRSWNYFPVTQAEVRGKVEAPTDRLFLHIVQGQNRDGSWSLGIENIGWSSAMTHELNLEASVGIQGLIGGFTVATPLNPRLAEMVVSGTPKGKPYGSELTLSDPVFTDCRKLKIEEK